MKLFKIPYDDSDSAPDKIISELRKDNLNEGGFLPYFDIGEIKKDNMEERFLSALDETNKIISISGNHSISKSLINSFSKRYNNCGIVIFDAHPDCEDGNDLLPSLINAGIKKQNIILIGMRSWKKQEFSFLKNNRIRYFEMEKIIEMGKRDIIETVMEAARNFEALYISIDLDVLDPSFAPGVDCYEPGGLSSRDLLFFLHRLKKLQNLKAIDITELKPEKDVNGLTAKLAAKLVIEMC